MPEPEQGERCQLCGSLVEVVSSDEGTSCYRPVSAEQGDVGFASDLDIFQWQARAEKAERALAEMREAHAFHVQEDGPLNYCSVCDDVLDIRGGQRS